MINERKKKKIIKRKKERRNIINKYKCNVKKNKKSEIIMKRKENIENENMKIKMKYEISKNRK